MNRFLSLWLSIAFFCCIAGCRAQNEPLIILHTNDTHSQIEPFLQKNISMGGFLRREAFIREERARHSNVLLFDAGDFSQGTPFFNVYKGYVEIYLMNKMHYNAVTLGNQEFDNGSAALAKRLQKANFSVVCANYLFHNKSLARQVKPYTILRCDGLKIGIFGLTVDLTPLVSPEVMKDLTYLNPIEVAIQTVAELKKQNCDMIICLSHLGYDDPVVNDRIIAKQVPDIDLIIGGHTHKFLSDTAYVGDTPIYQLKNKGGYIGEITITY